MTETTSHVRVIESPPAPAVDWQPYDRDDGTRPSSTGMVWVYDPEVFGVTIAWYNQHDGFFTHMTTPDGNPMLYVSHWAVIAYPEEPDGVDD